MVRLGKNFVFSVLLAAAFALPAACQKAPSTPAPAQTPAVTSSAAGKTAPAQPRTHHRKKKAEPVAEMPQTPPPPPTLDQQSPVAPQVSYRNGLLSINAPNSTLSSILRAVQMQTGATMDLPAGAGSDRVAMQLGPGEPRDIISALLTGSKFDYMILGVVGRPGAVQKVILTPKLAGGATTAQANNAAPPQEPTDDTSDTGGESEYPGPSAEQQRMPPGAFRRPMGAPGGQAYQQQQENQENGEEQNQNSSPFGQNDPNVVQGEPNGAKSPEQLMQELQQMQQQQQQYQEQLNPANQAPPQ